MTDSYLGWTVKDLQEVFCVVDGALLHRKDMKPVGTSNAGHMRVWSKHPRSGEVKMLYSGRVAYIIQAERYLLDTESVAYNDKNCYNVELSNLFVVKRGSKKYHPVESNVEQTGIDGIIYYKPNGLFMVRRGPSQSVFRSFSLAECVAVLKRWKNDSNLNEWDFTMPVAYR